MAVLEFGAVLGDDGVGFSCKVGLWAWRAVAGAEAVADGGAGVIFDEGGAAGWRWGIDGGMWQDSVIVGDDVRSRERGGGWKSVTLGSGAARSMGVGGGCRG